MGLYQCEHCGCVENTALACQGCNGYAEQFFDWTGVEDRKGKLLCSACAPTRNSDGTRSDFGKWHGRFQRTYLPLGMFKTNREGSLAHIETGDTNFRAYAIRAPQATSQDDADVS